MADFLLELLSEEIPARMQAKARNDLARLFAQCTEEAGLKTGAIDVHTTPRRLVLIAREVAESTEASREEVKGPRANAPAQALEGFLRKTGLSREQLEERDGVLFATVERPGRAAAEILAETVKRVVADFPWPKSMRWGAASTSTGSLRWVRPLHGIVAMLGEEIVPVTIPQRKKEAIVVGTDEHPRADTSLEGLAKLPTPFRLGGTVTAGNASGVNDGAAALIVASEAAASRHGLTPMARVLGGAAAGVPPRIMGMGPAPATRKLCARLGLTPQDFDVIELNEAFASQALAVLRELGLADDAAHVNANGGAIALGHPLGMSGARIAGTAHDDPGAEIGSGPAVVRVRIERQVVPLWPISISATTGEWDRSVVAGEADGRWLWLVLRPASAMLLLRDDWILRDASQSGPHLVELPFGGPAPLW